MSKSNFQLWREYQPAYMKIQKNPVARQALHDDPGVKFMRAGWTIVLLIILGISVYMHLS